MEKLSERILGLSNNNACCPDLDKGTTGKEDEFKVIEKTAKRQSSTQTNFIHSIFSPLSRIFSLNIL